MTSTSLRHVCMSLVVIKLSPPSLTQLLTQYSNVQQSITSLKILWFSILGFTRKYGVIAFSTSRYVIKANNHHNWSVGLITAAFRPSCWKCIAKYRHRQIL